MQRTQPTEALIFLVEHGEERSLRFSEVLYREGEKSQDWCQRTAIHIRSQLNILNLDRSSR